MRTCLCNSLAIKKGIEPLLLTLPAYLYKNIIKNRDFSNIK